MPPQTHPQAQFVPIPPEFDLHALVESSDNFDYVTRLSTEKLKEHSIQSFEALVLAVVIQSGKPLLIEDWGDNLPPWLFSKKWLEDNFGTKAEVVRDIPNEQNIPMTMGHYLRSMEQLTKQFTTSSYRDPKRQRLYLKDIDCPEAWANHLKNKIPECVYYLNQCIESRTGGDGAVREPNEYGQMGFGKGVAPAGDLMSSLPPEMRALNMMCYIGHEGTYTAAHREMCATLGHNIMVEASQDGNGQREGSSLWFMTETKERELVSEYFLSMLGHEIEVEKHFAQVNAWKKAPFNVWVVEQRVGDLILIPPLAPHQVWNRGTRTMKVAWNRTTVDTLELALHEALPRARMVCRDEQYKCKAIIYYTLIRYNELLQRGTIEEKMWKYGRIKQLLDDFKRLFYLYQEVIVSEMFSPKLPEEENVEMFPYDSNVTCSYCRCNIFNRFLTCKSCILSGTKGAEDTYDICMDCYAMGRSCACLSNLSWVEQWDWQVLESKYEQWRSIVVRFDGYFDSMSSPQPLGIARKRYGNKPIAEVCQEQLKFRPWVDITKPKDATPDFSEPEVEVDDEGRVKKKKGKGAVKRKNKVPKNSNTHSCHICFHQEWNWKLAFCTTCSSAYCYGVLWRAFDMMPQTIMEDKDWQCPRCRKICSCGKCRKGTVQKPYQPKGTLLGHDTRTVADSRSVESLVDFSKTNLTWLRDDENPRESARMKRLKEKAEVDKARVDTVDETYLEGIDDVPFGGTTAQGEDVNDIDPSLRDPGASNGATNNTSHIQTPYRNGEPATNGVEQHPLNGGDEHSNNFLNGHFDLDDFGPANQTSAQYPSCLTAPTAPMLDTESAYPDPSHVGQNRMMGIGYYQQGINTIDRIVYDAPNSYGANGSNGAGDQPGRAKEKDPLTLSLADLMDPSLQPVGVPVKKRMRIGEGDGDEEDVEFFTSKRQKKLASSKKYEQQLGGPANKDSRTPKNLPRRSVGMPKTYIDLGGDAVPIEDDEGPSTIAYYNHRKQYSKSDSDLEPAAQALKRLSKPKAKKVEPEVRRSTRGQQGSEPMSPAPPRGMIKTPRKSAWLARKEAGGTAQNGSGEKAKRGRPWKSGVSTSAANDVSSAEEDDVDDGGVSLGYNDGNDDLDSLFGEPNDKEKSPEDAADVGGMAYRPTVPTSKVRIVEFTSKPKEDGPTPKRRGRPPKHRSSIENVRRVASVELESPSLPPPAKGAPSRMLSLKERLALEGKSFKIVAKKPEGLTSAGPSTAKQTPAPVSKPTLEVRALIPPEPVSTNGVTVIKKVDFGSPTADSLSAMSSGGSIPPIPQPKGTRPTIVRRSGSNPPTPQLRAKPAPTIISHRDRDPSPSPPRPKSSGPTVVRLASPESEVAGSSPSMTSESDANDSSDDDIPAVKMSPKKVSGETGMRGRPGMTARRGRPPRAH